MTVSMRQSAGSLIPIFPSSLRGARRKVDDVLRHRCLLPQVNGRRRGRPAASGYADSAASGCQGRAQATVTECHAVPSGVLEASLPGSSRLSGVRACGCRNSVRGLSGELAVGACSDFLTTRAASDNLPGTWPSAYLVWRAREY